MLENIFVNVRNHSAKMTGSLSVDNLKEHTAKFSDSIDSLRSKLRTNSTRVTSYLSSVNQDNYVDQPYSDLPIDRGDHNLPSDDEENIVGKFIRVITIDDDDQPNQTFPMAANHRNRRRNDREEIRRRLAMGPDVDEYLSGDRPGRKPSLQARLQSGMNLQICFMNETLSDTESPSSEGESRTNIIDSSVPVTAVQKPETEGEWIKDSSHLSTSTKPERPLTLPLRLSADQKNPVFTEADFLERQAQLQAEARVALVQAKDMAHMQMEMERQRMNASPITEMIRNSLQKVGVHFMEDRRRLSRQMLTEMNVAQLQVIVNDLHTQIEYLNEKLVKLLIQRDDLHMEQDSMLVDIEDLTRYLGAKDQALNQNNNLLSKTNTEITGVGVATAK